MGRKLVPHLKKCGHQVIRADIVSRIADVYGDAGGFVTKDMTGLEANTGGKLLNDYAQHDVVSLLDLYKTALSFKPDVIYHMAAMVSRVTCDLAPHLAVDTNLSGTNNVAQLCLAIGAKMINFSTSEIYGNIGGVMDEERKDIDPNNYYGFTKYLAEKIVEYQVRHYGLKAVTIRPFMLYDEDEVMAANRSAIVKFAFYLLTDRKIKVHKGSKRSWLHVDDAVVLLEKLMYLDEYHLINIGHPRVVEMEYIAKYICQKLGKDPDKYLEYIDMPIATTLEKQADLKRQTELLKYEPKVDIEEGIDRVLERLKRRLQLAQ